MTAGSGSTQTAIGLMSGTSMDGVDAAAIRTDGGRHIEPLGSMTIAYGDDLRAQLAASLGQRTAPAALVRAVTDVHVTAVARLLEETGIRPEAADVIGFHGHTILHEPWLGRTIQIGDGAYLAAETGIDVVWDLRGADVAGGGQGAPLVPLFHAALFGDLPRPLAVLNIGGVANVTWIGRDFDLVDLSSAAGGILAFDCGPGNALLDDWVLRHTGRHWDEDGALAAAGAADGQVVSVFLTNRYFHRPPPKSLDRNDFRLDEVADMPPADGAATLVQFTAHAVAQGRTWFPEAPARWLVCGGGRHNSAMMAAIREQVDAPFEPVETVGVDGDALEAQAFAWLAVRSRRGLPLTVPTTTGVARPTVGGRFAPARAEPAA